MAENHLRVSIFINKDLEQVIHAKQGDANSRFLDVTLLNDNGMPYDLTNNKVRFNALKKDNTTVFNDTIITNATGGQFTVELTDQTLALGNSEVRADITVFNNTETAILTTRTFSIWVQTTIRNDSAIESSNEFGAVINLFQDVWDMRETIRDMSERMGERDDDLQIGDEQVSFSILGALNRIWNYLKTQSTAGIVEAVNEILIKVSSIFGLIPGLESLIKSQKVSTYTALASSPSNAPVGTITTVVNVTGAGVLKLFRLYNPVNSGGKTHEIYIDGIRVLSQSYSSTVGAGWAGLVFRSTDGLWLDTPATPESFNQPHINIAFNTSLKITVNVNTIGTGTVNRTYAALYDLKSS